MKFHKFASSVKLLKWRLKQKCHRRFNFRSIQLNSKTKLPFTKKIKNKSRSIFLRKSKKPKDLLGLKQNYSLHLTKLSKEYPNINYTLHRII